MLLLNWFSIEIAPASINLPVKEFEAFDDSTSAMRERLRDFKCYRPRPPRGASPRPAVILLNGPPPPADWPTLTFDLASNADLAGRIALESLAKHFIKREATVHHTRFALFCVWSVEDHDNARIRLFSGLRVKAHRPSAASKPGIAVNWEVEARFTASLADELLRSACQHLGVSLRYYGDEWPDVPEDLKRFRNKYLGEVSRVISADRISVDARDGHSYSIPPQFLFLEAKPSTMYELERRLSTPFPTRRLQELSLVLTKDGRRNSSVVRDRLDAVRKKLSPQGNSALIMPLQVYGGGKLIVDVNPLQLNAEGAQ